MKSQVYAVGTIMVKTVAVLLGLLLTSGCSPGLRGDGTLAVLVISDKLHAMKWWSESGPIGGPMVQDVGDMVDAYCFGAHLWDVVGAKVRCAREVNGQPYQSSVGVVVASKGGDGDAQQWWNPVDGEIHVAQPSCATLPGCGALAAHEIGHALGLGHLPEGNLMAPGGGVYTLQPGDIDEFKQHWKPTAAE